MLNINRFKLNISILNFFFSEGLFCNLVVFYFIICLVYFKKILSSLFLIAEVNLINTNL